MPIKTLSNTSREELVQNAYSTFAQNKTLTLNTNRQCSRLSLPSCGGLPLIVNRDLRDICLADVTPKVEELASFFFSNLNGDVCYIDQEVVESFTKLTKRDFPDLKFIRLFAVVDKETDIELFPETTAPEYAIENEGFSIAIRIKAWVAKLIPE